MVEIGCMHIWDQGTVARKVFSKCLGYMQNPLWHSRMDETQLPTTCLEKSNPGFQKASIYWFCNCNSLGKNVQWAKMLGGVIQTEHYWHWYECETRME